MLNGLKNFLQIIDNNWTTILIIIGLGISLYKKITDYISKTDEEKIEIAKKQIQQSILKMITDAEFEYAEIAKAGSIKRSQVIEEVFKKYPILSKIVDQESIVAFIDEEIDNALKTLREIIENNQKE